MHRTPKIAALAVLVASLLGGLVATQNVDAAPAIDPVAAVKADPPQERIRERIATTALGQVGQHEKGGANHYPRKYQLDKTVFWPTQWCGVFVYWTWTKSGATGANMSDTTVPPKKKWDTVNQGHLATYWQAWAKKHKLWKPIKQRSVVKGDAVVYGNFPQQKGHIGVVVDVKYDAHGKATHIKTVEGNVHDSVVATPWRKLKDLRGGEGNYAASGFVSAA
ncbi:hypothetical protein Lesp02_53770 [Lentzea sp. NBRC 105346]|uniref:CHAP domain-containing protein n=1 Tax=Lentzea sp. NBRC 105346 TaxID=3032205 RepID=UPI00249FFDD5|nr:CHAP domain-containing protein [Lentzea sp. NBRC 105346]GLZ33189.1 hypothetical protein Lesp02_53770 [Lentzea sp. NBRC 105346]